MFWSYIIINSIIASKYILPPILNLINLKKGLTYKNAAKIVGEHFSEINDKLINLIELDEIAEHENELITASIKQKMYEMQPLSFTSAINLYDNKKHLKWIAIPVSVIAILIAFNSEYIITESSARIINHNTFFEPRAPYNYLIINKRLEVVQYEDFTLKIKITGNQIPSEVYLVDGKNQFKMMTLGNDEFLYKFKNVSSDITFYFFAGGYKSMQYTIKSIPQPKVIDLKTTITHPKHTGKKIEKKISNGDIIISEGSDVKWEIKLKNSKKCFFIIDNEVIKTSKKK